MTSEISQDVHRIDGIDERGRRVADRRRASGPSQVDQRKFHQSMAGGDWVRHAFTWFSWPIVIYDREHRVVDCNPAALSMFGWKMEEVLGQSFVDQLGDKDLSEMELIERELSKTFAPDRAVDDRPVRADWTMTDSSGEAIQMEMIVSGVRGDDGKLIGWGIIYEDVTMARRYSSQQDAIAWLSTVALQMRDVQELFDAAVSTPHVFLGADHVVLRKVVADRNELMLVAQSGAPIETGSLPEQYVGIVEGTLIGDVVRTQTPAARMIKGAENCQVSPDLLNFGTRSPVAAMVSCVRVAGSSWGVLSAGWASPREASSDEVSMIQTLANIVATVIERERTDQLRLQHERALRLGALGQMAAGVAHDLANVLAGIEATAVVAAGRPETGPEVRVHFEQIHAEAQVGHGIIDEILDFARLAPITPEPIVLADWLVGQKSTLEVLLPESCSMVVSVINGDQLVWGDPIRLRRAMSNLVDNAADALREGGGTKVAIRLSSEDPPGVQWSELRGVPAGPWARIDVMDDGHGIEADVLPRVFEPFFTTKSHRRGTGLGLAQVHGLVLQHGGHLSVNSTVGVGTTVSLWLPRMTAPAVPTTPAAHDSTPPA